MQANIVDHGAIADGKTDNASAIQTTIDHVAKAGGGRVIVPAGGQFLTSTIELRSHVELHLESGAVLLQPAEASSLRPAMIERGWKALVIARSAEYVSITGLGRIECQGKQYVAEDLGHIYKMKGARPFAVIFVDCRHVTFRDFTIHDAPVWTVCLTGCNDVTIDSIRILNDLKTPNSDGIDLDRCRNVRISNCHLECGDDCIVLKAMEHSKGRGPCENIVVRGCTLVSTSAALVIGCESKEIMRDVIFDSCVIKSSHRGLAIHLNEESDVENVTFSNMIVETRLFHHKWWGRAEPIYICVYPWTKEHQVGTVRHVRFTNILARGENGVVIEAQKPEMIQDVLLENVRVEISKTSKWPGGTKDIRPWPEDEGGAGPAKDLPDQPTAGFYIRRATDVTIRNCQVAWGPNRPEYFRHALEAHQVPGLKIENLSGDSAHPDRYSARLIEA